MSSTNRSNAREKHVSDYYVTPLSSICEFLTAYFKDYSPNWTDQVILDPCAGGDANHKMSYPESISMLNLQNTIKTIDLREDSLAEIKGDYLNMELDFKPSIIITNPPFNIALDIIKKALNDVDRGGAVIMLLRLNFFGSKQRYSFWKENMPEVCYVHSKRMSFTDNMVTDSIEYMHCVWIKGNNPKFSKIRVI